VCQNKLKEFKEKYPFNFKVYKDSCNIRSLLIGYPLIVKEDNKYIINLPTKAHWKSPSKLSYIEDGLKGLSKKLEDYPEITSIAFPKLGCGLGGLSWDKVYPIINYFSYNLPNLDIEVYI
jgi:hypothetical protein